MSTRAISKRVDYVWRKLAQWYGAELIVRNFGETPPEEWREIIDQEIRSREQLDRVLATMRTEHPNYPPRFPQFESIVSRITAPAPAQQSGPTVQERLADHVLRRYGSRLTAYQIRAPWTYVGREFDAPDVAGKMRRNHGKDITAVIVPADGDAPGYRVTVEDMQMGAMG